MQGGGPICPLVQCNRKHVNCLFQSMYSAISNWQHHCAYILRESVLYKSHLLKHFHILYWPANDRIDKGILLEEAAVLRSILKVHSG
jgi:hypothetical protein